MSIAFTLHLLAASIWVGGMFFAYVALRPVAATLLEPPIRLQLWRDVLKRFFLWVWIIIILLPISGYWMIFSQFQGMANVGISVHLMQLSGIVMIAIFVFLYFNPFKRMTTLLELKQIADAGKQLTKIRQLILVNLSLGLLTIAVASTHRF